MSVIRRFADNLVRYKGPTKVSGGTVLDDAASATALLKVLNQNKEQIVAKAQTRVRTAVAAAGTTILVPHILPTWLEASDTIEILDDAGYYHQTTITSLTPGTTDATPTTNFDTMVIAAGMPTGAAAGAPIRLLIKAGASDVFPVTKLVDDVEIGDVLEADLAAVPGTFDVETVVTVRKTTATEDGEKAQNQEAYTVLTFVGFSGNVNVGARLRHKFGSDVAMTEYGTVSAGSADWGYEGTILDTLAGLEAGMSLKLEVHFNGGAGLKDIVSILAPVVEA